MSNLEASDLNRFQYLFLGGILGEVLESRHVSNYLVENCEQLKTLGVMNANFKTLSSKKAAKDNVEELLELIKNLYKTNKQKIILFCHSKACLETLFAINKDSSSFTKTVQKVILVQPPLKGAPYLSKAFNKVLDKSWPGVSCLAKDYYTQDLEHILIYNKSLNSFFEKNLLIIKSYKESVKDVSWILRVPYLLTKAVGYHSDGLVRYKDQSMRIERYQHMTLNLDHSDLFCSSKFSNLSTTARNSIITNILDWAINEKELKYSNMPKEAQLSKPKGLLNTSLVQGFYESPELAAQY